MKLKDVKKNFLVETAIKLFLAESIDKVTVKDIASEAGVGEMTIYRYFGKKTNIVAEAVMQLQDVVFTDYFNVEGGKTGYQMLENFYNTFLNVFTNRPEFFKFIKEFDIYMMNEDSHMLQDYEDELGKFKNVYFASYYAGINDKSVKKLPDLELFYFTSTHALIELCKKLSYSKGVLPQDEKIVKTKEIECLINVFLATVKNS